MANLSPKISKKTLGTISIWIGLLAWVAYLYLISIGNMVSIWPFLFVHLVGSMGGVKLRGPLPEEQLAIGPRRRKISKVMIYLGVMVWLPYLYLDKVTGLAVSITPYLTAHLIGVIGGMIVRLSVNISQIYQRIKVGVIVGEDN